jgi:hypothetical protein
MICEGNIVWICPTQSNDIINGRELQKWQRVKQIGTKSYTLNSASGMYMNVLNVYDVTPMCGRTKGAPLLTCVDTWSCSNTYVYVWSRMSWASCACDHVFFLPSGCDIVAHCTYFERAPWSAMEIIQTCASQHQNVTMHIWWFWWGCLPI